MPPVVASVAEQRRLPPMPVHAGTSARKAGIVGAVFGLAVVAVFVVAVRLTYRPPPHTAAAVQPTTKVTVPVAHVVVPTPSTPVHEPMPSPSGAGDPVTNTQAQLKRNGPVAHPTGPMAAKAPPRTAEPQSEGTTANRTSVGGANSAESRTDTGQGAPADSAPSLIPVIPQGPPPEVDPLVKAVLEEDNPHSK